MIFEKMVFIPNVVLFFGKWYSIGTRDNVTNDFLIM